MDTLRLSKQYSMVSSSWLHLCVRSTETNSGRPGPDLRILSGSQALWLHPSSRSLESKNGWLELILTFFQDRQLSECISVVGAWRPLWVMVRVLVWVWMICWKLFTVLFKSIKCDQKRWNMLDTRHCVDWSINVTLRPANARDLVSMGFVDILGMLKDCFLIFQIYMYFFIN